MSLSAHTRSFRSGIADLVLSDRVASVFGHGGEGGEAGVQVPLLSDRGAGGTASSNVRMHPVCLQPGIGRADACLVAGAATGHLRGHVEDAHRLEARHRDRVVVGAVEGAAAGVAATVTGCVRQVLAQADRIPAIQEGRRGGRRSRRPTSRTASPTAAGRSGWPSRPNRWMFGGRGRSRRGQCRRR